MNWLDESISQKLNDMYSCFFVMAGNTQSEVQALQNAKLKAMDTKDTLERLDISMELVKNNISMVAAKLAIQSLKVP